MTQSNTHLYSVWKRPVHASGRMGEGTLWACPLPTAACPSPSPASALLLNPVSVIILTALWAHAGSSQWVLLMFRFLPDPWECKWGGWSHGDAQGRCCGRRCPPAWPPGVLRFPVARPSSAPSAGLHGNCLCLPVAFILETPFYSRGPSELKGIGGLWVLGSLRLGEREPEDAGTEGRELSPGSSPTWECPSVSSTARCQSRRCCLYHNHLVFRSQGASTIKQIATEGAQEITSKMMFHSTAQMGRQNNPMRMKSEYEN